MCQPVGVGINKVIKCGMHEKWEDWMLEGEGIPNGAAKEPTRELVSEWRVTVYTNIPGQMVRNAWMKKGMNGFKPTND